MEPVLEDLETVEVETGDDPQGSVIWLHGLGADGHDFEPIVPELRLRQSLRFVFPHAPVQAITVNGGMPMRAWYDIRSFDSAGRSDQDGVRASGVLLDQLIEREIGRGIAADKITIAGFSQGRRDRVAFAADDKAPPGRCHGTVDVSADPRRSEYCSEPQEHPDFHGAWHVGSGIAIRVGTDFSGAIAASRLHRRMA